MNGKTLGHYRVGEQLGRGGMGEVYVADDLNLNRKVALKFLPDAFAGDPERMARFEREAKLLASLNHPNIAAIYGLEQAEGKRFLVLELVEGETLAQRISKGALPVDESLAICHQIAEGLEAAHEKGVIHRDLKPANVMITEGDKVKILDFGLAKALSDETQSVNASQSPTLTEAMTRPGVILGTAAYMSPEQAKGKAVDKRADIWAFGCILYECITGKRAFEGETVTETLAGVLTKEPEWERIPAGVRRLLSRCLGKDPQKRLRDIGDGFALLEDPLEQQVNLQTWRRALPWMIAAAMGIAFVGVLFRGFQPFQPISLQPAHLLVQLPTGTHLAVETEHPTLALSPDGSQLVFIAEADGKRRLYCRSLADPEAQAIEGTEYAGSPFFSPDGEWVAFFQGNTLKKVSLRGGLPEIVFPFITPTTVNRGASWSSDGSIVFAASPNGGLSRTPISSGGVPIAAPPVLTQPAGGGHAWPEALPGGRDVLFTNAAGGPAGAGVALVSVGLHDISQLINGGTNPRYSPTGHILFARGNSLFALPFDIKTRRKTGPESKLADGLMVGANGAAQFAVSSSGTLAYVRGETSSGECELVWIDRKGQTEALLDNGRQFKTPRLSHDGSLLAVMSPTGPNNDIWVLNLSRGDFTRWTTHPGEDFGPVWNPNGGLAFGSEIGEDKGEGGPGLAWMAGQNSLPERMLETPGSANWDMPSSWSPDGHWLAFTAYRDFKRDIYVLKADDRKITPFLDTPFSEFAAKFSPDGQWIAYVSDDSGRNEVYVRPFPGPGDRIPISTGGGVEPLWSRDGRELFYREDNRLMTVKLSGGKKLDPSQPQPLFADIYERNDFGYGDDANYDVSLDGKRFVMVKRKNPVMPTVIHVVLNWTEALKVSR
jgi:eukaryotic-like serine/threonine-protein kinase